MQQLELDIYKPKFNTDKTRKLIYKWDNTDIRVKQYLCEMFMINSKIAHQPACKLDKWLKCLLISNLERQSNGYATFDFEY
jgi:hypothetical protein